MQPTRQLATIARVSALLPIAGADRIQLAQFQDRAWEIIVDKQVQIGQYGVLFEVDSFLPEEPRYEMLRKTFCEINGTSGFRLKTLKMRGVYSQGLFLTIDQFDLPADLHADCTAALNVLQWPDQEECKGRLSTFPLFIPKTEQKRVENLGKAYASDETFVFTEKLDGTSFTAFIKDNEFGYCSRNHLLDNDIGAYGAVVKHYDIEAKLRALNKSIAIQGEIIGPKIQGNRYKRQNYELYLFSAWDIDQRCRIPIPLIDIPKVPVVRTGPLPEIRALRKEADGQSLLYPTLREGFVLVSQDLAQSFKVISREFLCKN